MGLASWWGRVGEPKDADVTEGRKDTGCGGGGAGDCTAMNRRARGPGKAAGY